MNIIRTLAATAIIGAAALGLAGTANATATGGQTPISSGTYATPAPTIGPGWIAHLDGY